MEAFFNLAWVALSFALFAAWLALDRPGKKDSLLPPIGVQLIAIALLVVILLPVISLTDDLQAAPTIAESEHLSRRADTQPGHDQILHPAPAAPAQQIAAVPPLPTFTARFEARVDAPSRLLSGYFRAVATRPPPTA